MADPQRRDRYREDKERMQEGRCLFDNTIIDKNYLYSTNNSQPTVAKAKQSL